MNFGGSADSRRPKSAEALPAYATQTGKAVVHVTKIRLAAVPAPPMVMHLQRTATNCREEI
jgi:hypothetical protein